MLLNIDRPHGTGTLHLDGCARVPSPFGTPYKPVGAMGRDGGWFSVESTEEAKKVLRREFPAGEFRPCSGCLES